MKLQITSLVALATFVTLLFVATAARPGPREEGPIIPTTHECDTTIDINGSMKKLAHDQEKKGFSDDFEPRPNISAYGGDETKMKYTDDFEPRPNISAYGGDDNKVVETERKFADDFEPRPNISAYVETERKYANDFEPRPNISAYGGGDDN